MSHKIGSTFFTKSTLWKLLCKTKHRVATEDKNNIVYETGYSYCEGVFFTESKWSLKSRFDEHKRSARNFDVIRMKLQNFVGKQITTLAGIRSKFLLGKTGNSLEDQRSHSFFEQS